MSLLGGITGPADLKELSTATLGVLATEIRAFLIDKVSDAGGHLGPNLGVVELTIAALRSTWPGISGCCSPSCTPGSH
jgi:1-deoxy-D-xylulose-5-phosphate synthase